MIYPISNESHLVGRWLSFVSTLVRHCRSHGYLLHHRPSLKCDLIESQEKKLKKKRNECLFIPLTPKRVISSNSNFNTSLKASNFNTSLYWNYLRASRIRFSGEIQCWHIFRDRCRTKLQPGYYLVAVQEALLNDRNSGHPRAPRP